MTARKVVKRKPIGKKEAIQEAIRYLENAKDTLKQSSVENDRYQDIKYSREASSTAYLAALIAIEGWMVDEDLWTKKSTKSIEAYHQVIHKHPFYKQLNDYLNIVYENLHLFGYYSGASSTAILSAEWFSEFNNSTTAILAVNLQAGSL